MTLLEFFQAPRFRTFRAVLFTALGSWGFAPALHGLVLYGRDEPAMRQAFAHYATMGALYVIGAATFAARIPERWAPGKFDIWGHSHQLFHVAIVAAAALARPGAGATVRNAQQRCGCAASAAAAANNNSDDDDDDILGADADDVMFFLRRVFKVSLAGGRCGREETTEFHVVMKFSDRL